MSKPLDTQEPRRWGSSLSFQLCCLGAAMTGLVIQVVIWRKFGLSAMWVFVLGLLVGRTQQWLFAKEIPSPPKEVL